MTNTIKYTGLAGLVILLAGYVKTYTHTQSLSPFAGSYCGKGPAPEGMLTMGEHCWGCGAMPLGAMLLVIAVFLFLKGKSPQ